MGPRSVSGFFCIFLLIADGSSAIAGGKYRLSEAVSSSSQRTARLLTGDEPVALPTGAGRPWTIRGPGVELDFTYYDYGSNGSMPNDIYNYGDGTLFVARHGAHLSDISDRGVWFRCFDGEEWGLLVSVSGERTGGPSSVDALLDGRSAILDMRALHIDAAKCLAIGAELGENGTPVTHR